MKIAVLLQRRYRIAAVKEDDGTCPALDFLAGIGAQFKASATGLLALLEHIADCGLGGLSSKLCHCVNRKHGIYELIKGRLRLFFFKGDGGIVLIATHGIIKKSQKTPRQDIDRAIAAKKAYDQAKAENRLVIEREDDE